MDVKIDNNTFPDIKLYGFSIDVGGVVNALTKIKALGRLPQINDCPFPKRTRQCSKKFFHDYGYKIKDCITLIREDTLMLNK